MNEGLTRPKGPGHPVVGLRVNCPPLGLSGKQSSSGGSAASAVQLYSVQCVHSTAELFFAEHCTIILYTVHFVTKPVLNREILYKKLSTDRQTERQTDRHTEVSIELLRN